MAKRKRVYWTRLSAKQRAEYNRRLENAKSVRKSILEAHQAGARSMIGEGAESLRSVPDLVLPREFKKQRFHSQREYAKTMAKLKKYHFDEKEYFKRQYKGVIVGQAYEDALHDIIKEKTNDDVKPEGRFGLFTEEQKDKYPEFKEYMDAFNDMQRMSGEEFKRAYFEGFIVPFKFIYHEMKNTGKENMSTTYLDQQAEMIQMWKESGRGR